MIYTTEQKKENVRKIRDYLAENNAPPEFNMQFYCNNSPDIISGFDFYVPHSLAIYYECGTSACFAGHGPLAGIAPLRGESWDCYIGRCFVDNEALEFPWLFGAMWAEYPYHATAEAAVKRADVYLESGVPKDFTLTSCWCEDYLISLRYLR